MGGYKDLAFYKQTEIIHDFTMEFCAKYIDYHSRTKDQMEQAARSGKQNISEGYAQQDYQGKLKLMKIARGSLEELLVDYQDFLRQRNLPLWDKDNPKAKEVRNLVYKINPKDNGYNNYNAYNLYKVYLGKPEDAANAMICLINQTNMMMNRKIQWIEQGMKKEDAFSLKDKWMYGQMEKSKAERQEFDNQLQEIVEGKRQSLDEK